MSIREHYPEALLKARCWGLTKNDKIPYYIGGGKRQGEADSASDRAGFHVYDTAESQARALPNFRPTLILGRDPYSGLQVSGYDFDHCVHDGIIDDRVLEVIKACGSYVETSMSGNGVHIVGTGLIGTISAKEGRGVEAYSGKRHFVPTGNCISGSKVLCDITHVAGLIEELFPQPGVSVKQTVKSAEAGGRNNALSDKVYGWVRDGYVYEDELLYMALQFNDTFNPPLPRAEVKALVVAKLKNVKPDPVPEFTVEGEDAPKKKAPGVVVERLNEIVDEKIEWIWQDGLACGKLHMLAGVAGTGKTTIALNLCAPVTGRGQFPDGRGCPIPGSVVIWSGEDGVRDTLAPRLRAAGCDPLRVHIVTGMNLPEGGKRMFDPSTDLAELIKAVRYIGDVRLLIIEPIVMMAKTDSHKNAETRRDLAPLIDLAEELKLAVLGITHFSKGTQGHSPVERLTGSLAFGAAPRIVWTTAVDEEDPTKKYFIKAKANICADGGGFAYQLAQKDLGAPKHISASYVKWGEAVQGTAKSLLNEAEGTKRDKPGYGGEVDHAKQFLLEQLSQGGMLSRDLEDAARANGISERTLNRARKEMGARAVRRGTGWVVELDPMGGL